ncbi:MAG: SOS response-associated peptidase, partial [Geobacteraceae bacterium]
MCGRFVCDIPPGILSEYFNLPVPDDIPRSFNIPPSSMILAVRCREEVKELALLRWGLIPSWTKDVSRSGLAINARSETVDEKPTFRQAFRHRRCIIPASGFFEWKKDDTSKQPYHIRLKSRQILGLAGIWERWISNKGESMETCAILTVSSNSLIRTIHDRMPVIIRPEDYSCWLNPDSNKSFRVKSLCVAYPSELMEMYPVSPLVNNPRN